jgi:hypothetical protein
MYLQQRNGLLLFCHFNGGHVHQEHLPESAEHKALIEREVRTCERVGASVKTEVRTARWRRRADFIAVGTTVTLAGEIQLTSVTRRSVGQRQRDLARAGNRVLWTTDSTRPDFLDGVPRLVIPALSGWQQALRDPELAIVAGWWLVEYQRCGWSDAWSGGRPRCPRTGSLRPCGRMHAYPTRNATTLTYRPTDAPVAKIGTGDRPHLDSVVGGIVMGDWLPYKRKVKGGHQFEWIPARDYDRVVEDRGGGDPKETECSPGVNRQAITSAERTCEAGRGSTVVLDPALPDWREQTPVLGGEGDDGGHLQRRMDVTTKSDSWADHPRWRNSARCTTCGQPLFHRESISLGVCAQHRASG